MSKERIDFESLYQQILEDNRSFPEGKLRNRLINLGIKDLLAKDEISNFGIPFKFVEHFDESTLALAYFANRLRNEGGSLKVYGVHKLQKGNDKTFSPWITGRGRLFTELQNLVLLMKGDRGRNSEIQRIFVLQDISDIAFFYQSAISVLSEQVSLGIKIGFLLLNRFGTSEDSLIWRRLISNSLIIEYKPPTTAALQDAKPNYYFLHDIDRQDNFRDNLPYIHGCLVKWAEKPEDVSFFDPTNKFTNEDFTKYRTLFQEWEEFKTSTISGQSVLKMVDEGRNKFYNNALLLLCRAFKQYELDSLDLYHKQRFIRRLFDFVITPDLMRLEKAMTAFETKNVKKIKAIDSTSVKNTLNIHESDPMYRQWLRRSLNRVLRSESEVILERIYIIDDKIRRKEEYPVLVRNLQYYLDYLNFEISEIREISDKHKHPDTAEPSKEIPNSMDNKWSKLKDRVKVYVTTSSILESFAQRIMPSKNLKYLAEIRHYDVAEEKLSDQLSKLDFLFTEEMIYDFNNPRGDPGELKFDAYLIRKDIDLGKEKKDLFDFTGIKGLEQEVLIKIYRSINLANSIIQYKKFYKDVECKKFKALEHVITFEEIRKIKAELNSINTKPRNPKEEEDDEEIEQIDEQLEDIQKKLIGYREQIETSLYDYLKSISEYFFDVLNYMSIEVDFWSGNKEINIKKIPPFTEGVFDMVTLREAINQKVQERLGKNEELPELKLPDEKSESDEVKKEAKRW